MFFQKRKGLFEISFIFNLDIGFWEHMLIKLGAIIVRHRRHIVHHDLVRLGFDIWGIGGVVIIGYEVYMMGEDG